MLDLGGAKRWTNNWLRDGSNLAIGDRVDVRVKAVDSSNKRVIVARLGTAVERSGSRVDKQGVGKEGD